MQPPEQAGKIAFKVTLLERLRISDVTRWKLIGKFILLIASIYGLYTYGDMIQNPLINQIVLFIVFALGIEVGVAIVRAMIISSYRKRNKLKRDTIDNVVLGIYSASKIVIFILIAIVALIMAKVSFSAFLTSFGLISVAFAWLFKEYIANLIDGLIIMFSQDFKVNDYIKFRDVKGKVKTIKYLNTELATDEGDIIYVPNTTILSNNVINYSKAKQKMIMIPFNLPQNKSRSIQKLEQDLIRVVKKDFKEYLSDEDMYLRISSVDENKSELVFEIPTKTYSFALEEKIRKAVFSKVLN